MPACSVTVEPSCNTAFPYVPGGIVAVPSLTTVTSSVGSQLNDGIVGTEFNNGRVNDVGPEFFGTTSEPSVRRFAYTSHTSHLLVIRIVSALTFVPSSMTTLLFAQMLSIGELFPGVESMPPAPTSPPRISLFPSDAPPLKLSVSNAKSTYVERSRETAFVGAPAATAPSICTTPKVNE